MGPAGKTKKTCQKTLILAFEIIVQPRAHTVIHTIIIAQFQVLAVPSVHMGIPSSELYSSKYIHTRYKKLFVAIAL